MALKMSLTVSVDVDVVRMLRERKISATKVFSAGLEALHIVHKNGNMEENKNEREINR